jgi:hypothetical protein
MSKSKTLLFTLALSIGLILSSSANATPTSTPVSKVKVIQSGWVLDRMLVFPGDANGNPISLTNPDNCPIVTNGYIIKETDPVHKTSYDMLIAAVTWNRDVLFFVDGCFLGRPRIIGVSLF